MFNYEQEAEERQFYQGRNKYDNNRAQNLQSDFPNGSHRENSNDYNRVGAPMLSRKSPRYDSKDQSMDSNLRRNTDHRKVENIKIVGANRNASFGKS